ncbi:ribonuclease H-like domain-containing protein [Tanacetum coccineum]
MAISSSSSSSSSDSEVQKCFKQCLESFKTLQKNYDTEREKHNKAKLEIRGYEIALESIESRILIHEKNELAWGEKYEFQNYELKYKEIKINNLNLELEKVVKERDELKDNIAKWEESSKNLDELLNSQMSARDKTGLGYGTQLNELSSNHETDSENSLSIFDVRSSLDEYAIRNKIIESQTTELNTKTSETVGKTNDANTEKPKSVNESIVSNPKINEDRVIIEDWNSNDEEEEYEVQTVRPETQTFKIRDDKSDCNFHDKKSQEPKLKNVVNTSQKEGKPVWDNTKRVNHQNFSKYPHLSKSFVPSGVLTRTGLHRPNVSTARPVCTARTSVSTARPVCTARLSVSTARPVCTVRPSVSTASPICTARPSLSTARPVYATRPIYPRMDNVRPRGSCSPIKRSYYTKPAFRPKDLKQDVKTFRVQNITTAGTRAVVNTGKSKLDTDLKKSRWVWRPKGNYLDHVSKDSGSFILKKVEYVDPKGISKSDHAVVDSGCSSKMTGNKSYLLDYEDFNGGFVAFGSDPKGDKITGKGKIKTANLDFDDVYFVDELKFNLFSVSQMCDKKYSVLFTQSECLILSPCFKLLDESQVVLRALRKDDVYNLDLKNIVPSGGITCLYANATTDESKLWHRRLDHVNFKNINKLVKGYLVRGLPTKVFVNDYNCVACKKGKQHKASCLENQLIHNVKIIRYDNGTEFKNHAMNEFCAKKGIKREFSVARTPQQNEAVNTACYANLKRKFKKVIVSASEGEEPEDQGRIIQDIDDDPLVSLFRESMKEKSTDFVTPTKASGEAQEEEISPTILEAAKTLSKVASQSVSKAKSTDKGKRYRRRARSMAKKINTGLDAEDEINTGIEDVNTGSTKVDTGRREGKA